LFSPIAALTVKPSIPVNAIPNSVELSSPPLFDGLYAALRAIPSLNV